MSFFAWVLFGVVAGLIINFIDPDKPSGGLVGAIVLGVSGALLGGILSSVVFGLGVTQINTRTLVIAYLSSLLLIFTSRIVRRTSGR